MLGNVPFEQRIDHLDGVALDAAPLVARKFLRGGTNRSHPVEGATIRNWAAHYGEEAGLLFVVFVPRRAPAPADIYDEILTVDKRGIPSFSYLRGSSQKDRSIEFRDRGRLFEDQLPGDVAVMVVHVRAYTLGFSDWLGWGTMGELAGSANVIRSLRRIPSMRDRRTDYYRE